VSHAVSAITVPSVHPSCLHMLLPFHKLPAPRITVLKACLLDRITRRVNEFQDNGQLVQSTLLVWKTTYLAGAKAFRREESRRRALWPVQFILNPFPGTTIVRQRLKRQRPESDRLHFCCRGRVVAWLRHEELRRSDTVNQQHDMQIELILVKIRSFLSVMGGRVGFSWDSLAFANGS
jgi:hypothetical protein